MDYQIFEILLLYAIYCILGWVCQVMGFSLAGKGYQNRGLCKGPYLTSYGLGAFAVIFSVEYTSAKFQLEGIPLPARAFCAGTVIALILGVLSMVTVNGLCGSRLIRIRWFQPILCGFLSVILIVHLNPLLSAYIRWMSPWVHLFFLLFFWMQYLSQLFDGISGLLRLKKKMHFSQPRE